MTKKEWNKLKLQVVLRKEIEMSTLTKVIGCLKCKYYKEFQLCQYYKKSGHSYLCGGGPLIPIIDYSGNIVEVPWAARFYPAKFDEEK